MIDTAEVVAKRYNISAATAQDEYAVTARSMRTAAAQAAGKFDDEIVPLTVDHDGHGQQGDRRGHLRNDEITLSQATRATARRTCWPTSTG